MGAKPAALAFATVALSDQWSALNNQAGLGFLLNTSAGACYEKKFWGTDFSLNALFVHISTKAGTFSLNNTGFGNHLYRENKTGLAYGRSFSDKLSFGLQFDFLNTSIAENYGSPWKIVGEAGLQYKLMKKITVGMHVYNPTRTSLAAYNDERVPSSVRTGFVYTFSEKVVLSTEVEKELSMDPVFKIGLEYKPVKQLFLRAGLLSDSNLASFGLGLCLEKVNLDLASSYHNYLGYSTQVSFSYEFN